MLNISALHRVSSHIRVSSALRQAFAAVAATRNSFVVAGRLDDRQIERAAAILFAFVGAAFALKAAAG